MDPANFDKMSRDELVAKARSLGVERPELMTRVELGDEIVRRTQTDPGAQQRARGWLGVARDLVASVVGSGLSMPDAAALIRGDRSVLELKGPSPVATVTLAEIYATQGHTERALSMLDEVLTREPEHAAALALRARLLGEPRTRRVDAAVGQPKSNAEPQVWAASATIEEDDAPRTSQTPPDEEAELPSATPELVGEAAPREVPPVHAASDSDAGVVDADAPAFEPVSLAPPLTDLPTRPDATALAAPVHPPAEREPEPSPVQTYPEPAPEPPAPEATPEPAMESPAPVSDAIPTPASPELRVAPAEPEPASGVEVPAEPPGPDEFAAEIQAAPEPARFGLEPVEPSASLEPVQELAPEPSQPQSDIVPTLLPAPMPEPEPAPALIVLRRSSQDPLVCWDLPESQLAAHSPLELDCHGFSASPKGTERRSVTVLVESRRGSAVLSGFARATLIRVALGTRSEGSFLPLVIASELRQSDVSLDVSFRPPLSESTPPTPIERGLIDQFAN
ncbi:MAG TPA: hypothetical protein VFQ35_15320 [Polyangiaceae bacterium]|nr:hypothetical protein [Polyangiaceae bacterium]